MTNPKKLAVFTFTGRISAERDISDGVAGEGIAPAIAEKTDASDETSQLTENRLKR